MREGTKWFWEIVDKSDPQFNKLDRKFDKMERKTDRLDKKDPFHNMSRGADRFGKKGSKAFRDVSHEIPGLERGMRLLGNPLTLIAVGLVAVGAAMKKGIDEAKRFNHEFLELENLNLGKTKKEIDDLKGNILDLSFDKGFDPEKVNRAFFDIQSATGKYGVEVDIITDKIGTFSRVMKTDFNKTVEGTSKGMEIFGFGTNKVDDYLASMVKTVQVGVTTFDQLSKVQVEYAGAAAAANQGYDEANKLFALNTKNAKNVDIAATLTKGAFEDLAKKSTIEGLKKLNVNLFDSKGNLKKIDDIAKDLVPKLQKMSGLEFALLKEEIGGNEGLRALFDQLKNSGDQVLRVFDEFDKTGFNIDGALENSKHDLAAIDDAINNKLKVSWIRLGQEVMPMWIEMKNYILEMVDSLNDVFDSYNRIAHPAAFFESVERREARLTEKDIVETALDGKISDNSRMSRSTAVFPKGVTLENASQEQKDEFMGRLKKSAEFWKAESYSDKNDKEGRAKAAGMLKGIESAISAIDVIFQEEITRKSRVPGNSGSTTTGISGISSDRGAVRNITVNINAPMISEMEYTINEASEALTDQELVNKLTELMVRVVRQTESALPHN